MIDVGMGRHDHLAPSQREVELTDDLDNFIDRVFVTDIDQNPLTRVVHQIDAAAHDVAHLVVQLDYVRENRLALQHVTLTSH